MFWIFADYQTVVLALFLYSKYISLTSIISKPVTVLYNRNRVLKHINQNIFVIVNYTTILESLENCIGGVMVSMLPSGAVDHGLEP